MEKNLKLFTFKLFLFLVLIFLDQVVKFLVITHSEFNNKKINLIKNILSINYIKNHGVAFGTFNTLNNFILTFLIGAVILVFVIFIFVFVNKKIENNKIKLCIIFIISGGVSNYIDRLTKGFVIDYIELSFFSPIFNLADIYVTLGTLFLMFFVIFHLQYERS